MKTVKTACPLDCWDTCSIAAGVENNRVLSVEAAPDNPITAGFLCSKGRKHIQMLYHPERLKKPRLKTSSGWMEIGWDEALDMVAERLDALRREYPTTALLHCYDCGHGGLLKTIDRRFFNVYGGVTGLEGSLCWSAGMAAQRYDFGDSISHHPSDLLHSKTIILWGRNPMDTSQHLVPYLKAARDRGAVIITIDPVKTATAAIARKHLAPAPGTDGALALGMAHVLVQEELIDRQFIDKYTIGFEEFRSSIGGFSPEAASHITGIPAEDIVSLARTYGSNKPSALLLGYGLQRYRNGGNTIRAIDALGAMTGNIGVSGGGVNYANKQVDKYIDHQWLEGNQLAKHRRRFPYPRMAEYIERAGDPPVKMILAARCNPITQAPDSNHLMEAFRKVDFKVTLDLFMTDTALCSDLVLPCRHFLEDEDIIYTSMGHCYISYCNKAVEPDPWVPSELWIFNRLARRLELEGFPVKDGDWWLERAIAPLTREKGITLEDLKKGAIELPGAVHVAWEDLAFKTPSGKYEFYSEKALADGQSPVPVFHNNENPASGEFPYHFITPHHRDSLHSQHYLLVEDGALPAAYINPETGRKEGLREGDTAIVSSDRGSIRCTVKFRDGMREDVIMIYEGWWLQKNGGVNRLTPQRISDMGCQAALYDCRCNIRPES